MPPNALVVSHENAFKYASQSEPPLATPHGFACLIIATLGISLSNGFLDQGEIKPEDFEDVMDGLRIRGQAGSVLIGVGQTPVFLGSSNSEGNSTFRKVRKALLGF